MNTEQQLSFLSVTTPWSTPGLVKLAVDSVDRPFSIERFMQDYVCAFWKGHVAHRAFLRPHSVHQALAAGCDVWRHGDEGWELLRGERDFIRPNDWYNPPAVEVL